MLLISSWNLIFLVFAFFSFLSFYMSIYLLKSSLGFFMNWVVFSWGSCDVSLIFLFDWVSLMFISFVLLISGSVFFYSGEYMEGEKEMARFIFLLGGFVSSMVLLILSPNLISILLGWDGLGLVSYCLVIYYQNFNSLNAGTLTVLSNRVGDVLILLGIVLMINFGDWSFLAWMGDSGVLGFVSFLMILASLTKSAQIPFSAWLPAAMAAPTPVSSLVHSSTLVTAGVYLVIRLGWVYDFWLNEMLMILSVLTMFMAGLGASFEFDLKKVIALSTLSQLGLMMFSISLGLVKFALFHLLTHALFKALLFMSAGCIIHSYKGWQDLRSMGGVMISLPFMSVCFVISNLALSGMPFLAGFYSKDLILELSLMGELNFLSLIMLFLSTGLTVFYTFRLIYYVVRRSYVINGVSNISDGFGVMVKSCVGLTLFSVVFGSLLNWLLVDVAVVVLTSVLKNLTLLSCLSGLLTGGLISQSSYAFNKVKFSFVIWFSGSMWFLPMISSSSLSVFPLKGGASMEELGDKGWLEFMGGQGVNYYLMRLSMFMQFLSAQSLKFFIFVLWAVFSILFFF
uniref:NADH-ubiquinone oxidoreductase chain 5 n=1 Tax=Vulcanolepas fijiensis TaxID=2511776 RepID=A0A649YDN5_9CRUS|nr:NADH dehydrogenase subunit 5 [Vulcanolepas fijiensis]QGL53216.1 NADH dehydrogenase subunit 5 [Vulcanolepas fijiensis]